VGSWLTRGVDRVVVATYRLVKRHFRDYRSRDRLLATQAATILITQLLGWRSSSSATRSCCGR
ncbi:MAG: hypothetical protein ACXVW7_16700, partial [Trebonia sp.]